MSQSIRRVSRAVAVVRPLATLIVVMTVLSCARDQTTAPPMRSRAGPATHSTYTTLGTYSIPIPADNGNGAGVPATNTGIVVPAGTYYRVRVNGTVTTTLNPAYVALGGTAGSAPWTGTWGPGGTGNAAELQVFLKYRITSSGAVGPIPFLNLQMGASAPDSARTDVQYTSTQIEIQAGRNVIACAIGTSQGYAGCYLLTASQTVTVEQVTDVAHVVANPVAAHPNTQVTFTASRDDGGNLIVYNWHWQPDAGQPGNATNLCGGGNPCQMNVAGSGTMLVYTNAGNPTAHVTVYQTTNPDTTFRLVADRSTAVMGDTVTFTPTYNGVAGPAARWQWVPVDTTTHDNSACGDGVSPCMKIMVTSGTMWAYTSTTAGQGDSSNAFVTVNPPQLSVSCRFPGASTRGSTVQCVSSTVPATAFIVDLRLGMGTDFQVSDVTRDTVAGGDSSIWQGPAVAETDVTVTATVQAGARRVAIRGTSHFSPTPRAWPQLMLTAPPDVSRIIVVGYMTAAPHPGTDLGVFQLNAFEFDTTMVTTVTGSGPNESLSYFTQPVSTNGSMVGIHPALDPAHGPDSTSAGFSKWKRWYDDQNGTGAGTCTASDVATLKANVERHEGVTQAADSHYGKANQVFQTTQAQQRWERLYTLRGKQELVRRANAEYLTFYNSDLKPVQKSFDQQDTPTVFAIGCALDFNPIDP